MFDTYVTVVGNVLTTPEWRRTTTTGDLVASFKIASTARRLDRERNAWVDGNSLRVRVSCWRRLAEGVAASVMVGDPLIVAGRLFTRDWTDKEGNRRTLFELEAVAVGHDLARGRGKFARNRSTATTSEVDDPGDPRVRGEATEPVDADDVPTRFGDHPFDSDLDDDPAFHDPTTAPVGFDPLDELRGGGDYAGVDAELDDGPEAAAAGALDELPDGDAGAGDRLGGEETSSEPATKAGRARRGRGRAAPVPA